MPSRSFLQLLSKELRELFASRAFWLMLLIVGALVGHGFITAVGSYSEVSGNGSGPAALPQGLTPLDGILVPTWGAYDLVAMLIFPFVAIRMIAAEKESGALKLLLQLPHSLASKVAAKGLVLVAAWMIALDQCAGDSFQPETEWRLPDRSLQWQRRQRGPLDFR